MSAFVEVGVDDLVAYFQFPGHWLPVNGRLSTRERFRNIKANYQRHQAMVEAGLAEWFDSDPYELGDWSSVFTPIENAVWSDIRMYGLDLWPQLPVGRFFVDFGNPVAKLALECDGAEWHQDKDKDAERDYELERMGWRVLRIPGWQCVKRILDREEAEERGIEDRQAWNNERTPYAALMEAKEILHGPRGRARVVFRARREARMEGLRLASSQADGAGAPGGVCGVAGEAENGNGEAQ